MNKCHSLIVALSFLAAFSFADEISAEPQALAGTMPTNALLRLSLDKCLELGHRFAVTTGQLDGEVSQAEARLRLARSDSFPQLHVSPQLRTYISDSFGTDIDVGIDLGPRFLEFPQNSARQRIARGRLDEAGQRAARAGGQLAVSVQHAYLRCLAAQSGSRRCLARLDSARAVDKAWRDLKLDDPDLQQRQSMSAIAFRHAQDAYGDSEALRELSFAQLMSICGLQNVHFELEELPRYTFPNVSLVRCLSWWQKHRTDLLALEQEVETMSEVIRLARLDRWPRARMGIGYDDGRADSTFDDAPDGIFAMVALSSPIWDAGQTRARVDEAIANRDELVSRVVVAKRELPTEVTGAFMQLRKNVQTLELMVANSEPARQVEEATAQLASGEISKLRYATQQLKWDSHCAAIAAQDRACYEAEAGLCQALQASRSQLAAGLPVTVEGAAP